MRWVTKLVSDGIRIWQLVSQWTSPSKRCVLYLYENGCIKEINKHYLQFLTEWHSNYKHTHLQSLVPSIQAALSMYIVAVRSKFQSMWYKTSECKKIFATLGYPYISSIVNPIAISWNLYRKVEYKQSTKAVHTHKKNIMTICRRFACEYGSTFSLQSGQNRCFNK